MPKRFLLLKALEEGLIPSNSPETFWKCTRAEMRQAGCEVGPLSENVFVVHIPSMTQ